MKKTLWIILGIGILASILIYVFVPLGIKSKSENKLIIGINIPMTGSLASIGEQIKSGMDLALEELQDSSLVLVYQDSKGTAKDGLNATNFLLENEHPNFIITNLTSVAMASKPILSQKKINAIYLSTHPDMTNSCSNCFRFFTSGKQEGDLLINEIIKKGFQKIGLLYVNDAYGEGTISYIRKSLRDIDPNISFINLQYPINGFDFQTILTRAKNNDINSLIVIGYGFEYQNLFQKLTELNYAPHIYSNFSFSNREGKEISDYEGEITFTAPTYDNIEERSTEMNEFATSYMNKYHSEPDFNAAYGYDNMKILFRFFKSDQSNFHSFLKNLEYNGAMGQYVFLSNGDVTTQLEIRSK